MHFQLEGQQALFVIIIVGVLALIGLFSVVEYLLGSFL